MNRTLLSAKVGVHEEDGKTRSKVNDQNVVFSNNTFHTLFPRAELQLNGTPFYTATTAVHLAFVETELTTDSAGEANWVKCQRNNY